MNKIIGMAAFMGVSIGLLWGYRWMLKEEGKVITNQDSTYQAQVTPAASPDVGVNWVPSSSLGEIPVSGCDMVGMPSNRQDTTVFFRCQRSQNDNVIDDYARGTVRGEVSPSPSSQQVAEF